MKSNIYDVYSLVAAYQRTHPDGHYFDRDTLKFFGESLSTMRLLKDKAAIKDWSGEKHTCYVLSKLQKKHPMGPRRVYAYFDVGTLDYICI